MKNTLRIVAPALQDEELTSEIVQREGWFAVVLRLLKLGNKPAKVQRMHLVETLPLGGKRQLMLVECWGRKYLVGCGAESVEAISMIEPQERAGLVPKVPMVHEVQSLVHENAAEAEWV